MSRPYLTRPTPRNGHRGPADGGRHAVETREDPFHPADFPGSCLRDALRKAGSRINARGCHRPACRSQSVIGIWAPADDRRNGARGWRRERDSNPRYRFWPVYSLSRGAPSTSRPSLRSAGVYRADPIAATAGPAFLRGTGRGMFDACRAGRAARRRVERAVPRRSCRADRSPAWTARARHGASRRAAVPVSVRLCSG